MPWAGGAYCDNCDLLVGLDGLHVLAVERAPDLLAVTIESKAARLPTPTGSRHAGVHRWRGRGPLDGIQAILRAGAENLTDKQQARITRAFAAQEAHDEVDLTWQCAQHLRSA